MTNTTWCWLNSGKHPHMTEKLLTGLLSIHSNTDNFNDKLYLHYRYNYLHMEVCTDEMMAFTTDIFFKIHVYKDYLSN